MRSCATFNPTPRVTNVSWSLVRQAMRARATRPRSKRASSGRPPSGAARKRAASGPLASGLDSADGGADGCGASTGAAGGGSGALDAAAAGASAAAAGGADGGGSSGEGRVRQQRGQEGALGSKSASRVLERVSVQGGGLIGCCCAGAAAPWRARRRRTARGHLAHGPHQPWARAPEVAQVRGAGWRLASCGETWRLMVIGVLVMRILHEPQSCWRLASCRVCRLTAFNKKMA